MVEYRCERSRTACPRSYTETMTATFIKRPDQDGAAEAEAAGLRWLREASDAVVEVHDVTPHALSITRVDTVHPTAAAARQAGRELARIHDAGAPAFGSPPSGWDGPNFIGTQRQECTPTADWATFYTEQRVLPFARAAHLRGNLDAPGLQLVERASASIGGTPAEVWGTTPARIHGDLWTGNLLFSAGGPVFIDPAAHGGHRETDLAMLALFGAPHLEEIRAGYQEIAQLPEGWLEYTPVHQLHPLAVHALTHGPSYGHALVETARATLDLLR